MSFFLALLVAGAATASPVNDVSSAAVQADPAKKETLIWAAANEFDQSQFAGDRQTMDRYPAAGFAIVHGNGETAGREDFIAGFTSPDVTFEPFGISKRAYIDLGGGGAIITGDGIIRGAEKGDPFSEHFRYADSFACRDGVLKVVYTQVTPIKPE